MNVFKAILVLFNLNQQARYSARAKVTVAGLTDGADAVSFSGRPEPPVRLTITSARP